MFKLIKKLYEISNISHLFNLIILLTYKVRK